MGPEAKTSFVIATRNRAEELGDVLRRLLDTTTCPIVLVDNASQDGTVAAARRIAASSAARLTIVPLPRNAGAVARNIGVSRCVTTYVAFCDDDSWWAPDATKLAEELFEEHPTVALLAGRTLVCPQHRDDPMVAALDASPLGREPDLAGPSILGFQACSAQVRKAAFVEAGGFSPILHFRGEEALLAWDLAARGWKLCFCRALVAYHQPSATRSTSQAERARVLRNELLSACMRRPAGRCVRAGAALTAAAMRDTAHARALLEACIALPAALRERRRLPEPVEGSLRLLEKR
jgi:GT2 family glycosyltransferase